MVSCLGCPVLVHIHHFFRAFYWGGFFFRAFLLGRVHIEPSSVPFYWIGPLLQSLSKSRNWGRVHSPDRICVTWRWQEKLRAQSCTAASGVWHHTLHSFRNLRKWLRAPSQWHCLNCLTETYTWQSTVKMGIILPAAQCVQSECSVVPDC